MKNIIISDITLREGQTSLSFKEKTEIAKQLDKLNVDIIEMPAIKNGKKDVLFLHTIAPVIKNSVVCGCCSLDEKSVLETYDAIKTANRKRLNIMIPVSTVQMEYICHKKPAKVLELTEDIISLATSLCNDIEVSLLDSTRAEKEFLYEMIDTVVNCGAKTVTLCDSAGVMLSAEFEEFISAFYNNVSSVKDVVLSVECSNDLNMASACAVACVNAGVTQIKTIVGSDKCTALDAFAKVLNAKADLLNIKTNLNMTVLDKSVNSLMQITNSKSSSFSADSKDNDRALSVVEGNDLQSVIKAIEKLGYELSEEDTKNVYEEFLKISAKKAVDTRELESLIASNAMQVTPTYKLKSYVINSGNIMTPTANLEIYKNGEILHGFSIGDGPIDAAFKAIEQITGHHYELDDFQIQSVTRGYEAVGESIVKLRYDGKLFAGKGTSTDIVGASINAYINALNKICFEEVL